MDFINPSPYAATPLIRSDWIPAAVMWVYIAAVSLWFAAIGADSAMTAVVGIWSPLITQAIAFPVLFNLIRGIAPGLRRSGWTLVLIALLADAFADIGWIFFDRRVAAQFDVVDAIGLLLFPLITAAGVCFYRDLGGSFRRWHVWLDVTTLALGLGATLWLFLLRPQLQAGGVGHADLLTGFAYAIGNGSVMIIAVLVWMQIVDFKAERALLLLIASTIIVFIIDLGWIGTQARNQFMAGAWVNIAGSCVPYALVGTAVALERTRIVRATAESATAGNYFNFLPIVSVLLAIALLFGEKAHLHGVTKYLLIAFVFASAVLVAARKHGVHRDVQRLYRALALQQAEARLSELVRRSLDVIALVDAAGRIRYTSPAAKTVLGVEPEHLKFSPVRKLLGPENEARLGAFFEDLERSKSTGLEIEVVIARPPGGRRVLRITGSDQRTNAALAGVVLTIRDVTGQRQLEREVLDIATRERERLSSDIHDGLGQELTGIALLLKSLNLRREREHGTLGRSVDMIAEHVARSVDVAGRLASGLSPLPVDGGYLDDALRRLAKEAGQRFSLRVNFHPNRARLCVDAAESEHLYRIAQESINNAARHSSCTSIDIVLAADAAALMMTVMDDGTGLNRTGESGGGLGLRMIEYRARAMGGSMSISRGSAGGTRLLVTVPRRSADCPPWPQSFPV